MPTYLFVHDLVVEKAYLAWQRNAFSRSYKGTPFTRPFSPKTQSPNPKSFKAPSLNPNSKTHNPSMRVAFDRDDPLCRFALAFSV